MVPSVFNRLWKVLSVSNSAGPPAIWTRAFSSSDVGIKRLNAIGAVKSLNHIAVAVPELKKAAKFYHESLGAAVSEPVVLKEHGVTIVFVTLDNTKIELLEPIDDESPIANFLKKRTLGGIHHICLEVEDLSASMQRLRAQGVRTLTDEPKIGAHGKPIVFLNPSDALGSLVELQQR